MVAWEWTLKKKLVNFKPLPVTCWKLPSEGICMQEVWTEIVSSPSQLTTEISFKVHRVDWKLSHFMHLFTIVEDENYIWWAYNNKVKIVSPSYHYIDDASALALMADQIPQPSSTSASKNSTRVAKFSSSTPTAKFDWCISDYYR